MKQIIVFGLLIIAVLLKDIKAEECLPLPAIWTESLVECANKLTLEQFRTLFASSTDDQDVKCFAECLYGRVGYFSEGQFSSDFMSAFLTEHVTHPSIEKYIENSVQAAEIANNEIGDECNKAHKFWLLNGQGELDEFQSEVFCDPEFPEDFRERFELDDH